LVDVQISRKLSIGENMKTSKIKKDINGREIDLVVGGDSTKGLVLNIPKEVVLKMRNLVGSFFINTFDDIDMKEPAMGCENCTGCVGCDGGR
jgi:hypothetical protein